MIADDLLPLSSCFLLTLHCILPSLFQVKCSMLPWPIRWLWRRPVQSVRRGMQSWQAPASSTLPGEKVWTDATMAGSLMAVYDTLLQEPGCNAGEVYSASGPCTATETRLAFQNRQGNLELIVLKVNSLTVLLLVFSIFIVCHGAKCCLHVCV